TFASQHHLMVDSPLLPEKNPLPQVFCIEHLFVTTTNQYNRSCLLSLHDPVLLHSCPSMTEPSHTSQ
ncbi:MAG: hypothetical protein ACK53Y_25965, partial [bacterium]